MTFQIRVFPTTADLAAQSAAEIAAGLREAADSGRRYLLGCPAGRSATDTFLALAATDALAAADGASRLPVERLVLVALDAYVTENGSGWAHVDRDAPHSCVRYLRENLIDPIGRGRGGHDTLREDQIWVPDPGDPAGFDERIRDAGGVDLMILASGSGDGHVGFNSPGADRGSWTRIVELPLSTRTDNLRTYPDFGSVDRVPAHGVTIGPATIAELSKKAVLLLPGPEKAPAFNRIEQASGYDPEWPSTIVLECRNAAVYADVSAAGESD
jgi:glucosamine-6-phosphate deaminase